VRVVATRGEFDSLDIILREYVRRGRIELVVVEPDGEGLFTADAVMQALVKGVDLAVLSTVMFQSGQVLPDAQRVVQHAHRCGVLVLLDVYHSLGAMPIDITVLDADFAVGGSYKYMRGGPGACWLYVHPRHLDAGLRTLDIGWFAKAAHQAYERPDPPQYAPGGDGWMESTPAVLPFYQARAGQLFVQGVGAERLRTHNLERQHRLMALLAEQGVRAIGGTADRGAFVIVRDARARQWAAALRERNVITDARGEWLRLCPDVLTTDHELEQAARELGALAR
jgi:kynureninase